MLYNIGDNPWYSNGPRCCYVCFLLKLLRTLNFGRVLFGFTKRDSSKAPLHSLMCMVCTTSWTQSRMHWMILNANSADSYSTWMTGWLWLDDSDWMTLTSGFRNFQMLQRWVNNHSCKHINWKSILGLQQYVFQVVLGMMFFVVNQNGMQRRFIGNPTKQLLDGVIFPETWKLRRKYHLLHTVTSWNKLIVVFFGDPPIMWSQV
jgi:hypothetical protein